MHFEVERAIAAKPAVVWSIITAPRRLETGGFGITRLQGEIAPGQRIKLWSEVAPNRPFALRVSRFEPNARMVWDGGMPLGLFRGVRQFVIVETSNGCVFRMREDYSGALLNLIGRSMPDLQPSFDKFADALKRAAEGMH